MLISWYEVIWLFFIYSFLGWFLEVIYAVFKKRKLINRGFLNGIICPVYGFSMIFMVIFLDSLTKGWFYLFLSCTIIGSVIELITGLMLEKIFKIRLWDYSHMKFQIGGYICLRYSLVWGILGTIFIKMVNPLLILLIGKIPYIVGIIFLIVFVVLLFLDMATTLAVLFKVKKNAERINEIAGGFTQASDSLRNAIVTKVERRLKKAYPNQKKKDIESPEEKEEARLRKTVFAYGCGIHKIVWIFIIGAFLGDIVETIFCWITTGEIMSRSSVVYGPFSLVWGIGVAGGTILLYKYRHQADRYIFTAGVLLGGVYEYICSVFTELYFGTVFWDYSDIPFNLGGRINLLYCFFWGIAALLWLKVFYPFLSKWIERIPMKLGRVLTYVFLVFMTINIIISAAALERYSSRSKNPQKPSENKIEEWLDTHFHNERMERIYPNAKIL